MTTIQDWAGRKEQAINAYQQAIRDCQLLDDALSMLLKAKYGKRAGDMRYRPAETVEIAQAMRAYLDASEQRQTLWLADQAIQ